MHLKDFAYHLPDDLIAHTPPPERSDSRLMLLQRESDRPPQDLYFSAILDLLSEGDLLVMNDTKVFPARLHVHKPSGGVIELLFLHPSLHSAPSDGPPSPSPTASEPSSPSDGPPSLPSAPSESSSPLAPSHRPDLQIWTVMAKPAKAMKVGLRLSFPGGPTAEVLGYSQRGERWLGLPKDFDLFAYLDTHGEIPLPPYIRPDSGSVDHRERYQTVYARRPGAVAAPTAGLHFTPAILAALEAKGVRLAWVTLHVGAGTFLPVRTEAIQDHIMHKEFFQISERTATQVYQTRREGGRIIAVGTTSLRALEGSAQAFHGLAPGSGLTDIFIYPGYRFQIVDGLLTNFHLPCSTLLMLVSAFHGHERTLAAYRHAVERSYRFYSYGDAMLILPGR